MKVLYIVLIILGVALTTGLIVFFSEERLSALIEAEGKALGSARNTLTFAFSVAAVVFGLIVLGVYLLVASQWPDLAKPLFFWASLGLTIFFSIGAVVVYPQMGIKGLPEVLGLNLLWGLGYGWLLTYVLRAVA